MKRNAKKSISEKKQRKKISKPILFLRTVTIIMLILSFARFLSQRPLLNQCNQKLDECSKQIEIESENIEHYKNLKELYKSEEYQMIIAKDRLGLVEENEKVYVDANGK